MDEQLYIIIYMIYSRTSSGVQWQVQQMPAVVLCLGKAKVSPMYFQSPLTSINADLVSIGLPASFILRLSRAWSSCRELGWTPNEHHPSDQLIIAMMSHMVFVRPELQWISRHLLNRRSSNYIGTIASSKGGHSQSENLQFAPTLSHMAS